MIVPTTEYLKIGRCVYKRYQQWAMLAVNQAVQGGRLPHPTGRPCADCGSRATEYDHRDYSRPLRVAPVCRRCNIRRGPARLSEARISEQLWRGLTVDVA